MLSRKKVAEDKKNPDRLLSVAEFDAGEVDSLVDAKRYGYPISLEQPSYMLADGNDTQGMTGYHLRRLLQFGVTSEMWFYEATLKPPRALRRAVCVTGLNEEHPSHGRLLD